MLIVLLPVFSGWAVFAEDWSLQGLMLLKEKRFGQAIEAFSKAIDADLDTAEPYNNRGVCRFFTGDLKGAIADYTRALELNTNYAEAYKNRGGAWFYKKDYARAIQDYTHALDIVPEDAETYYHRGIAEFHKGEYRKSIADHTHALRLWPNLAAAANQIAWTLATCPLDDIRNGPRAVKMAQKALALDPEIIYLDTLASAYAEAGRFQDAVSVQKKVIAWLQRNGKTEEIKEGNYRLFVYRAHKPWRDALPVKCNSAYITAFIEAWRKAWERGDLQAYIRFYHPDARQGELAGKMRIGESKQTLWQRKKPKRIAFGPPRIDADEDGCRVAFRQEYQNTAGYSDSGIKTLQLFSYGSTYLIIGEQWRGR